MKTMLKKAIHPIVLWLDSHGYSFSNFVRNSGWLKHRTIRQVIQKTTMLSYPRVLGVLDAIDYIERNAIPGDIVVCGVWRGGLVGAICDYLLPSQGRTIWGYDTFEGNPEPDDRDGRQAKKIWHRGFLSVSEEQVRRNVGNRLNVRLVKGDILNTIKTQKPEKIALMYLDTDWYASTKAELDELYALVSPGGVVFQDDFGLCPGAEQATEDYFKDQPHKPLFVRLDVSARVWTKLAIMPQ